jgi:lipoprotein-releasing system permease protein
MPLVRWVAWRFMLKGTERGTFSAMTLFAWLAIGVGVGAMGSLLSVMYGFETTLRERVLTAYPHILVRARDLNRGIAESAKWNDFFSKVPGVRRAVPYLESEMIVQGDRRASGVVVWGVPNSEFAAIRERIAGEVPSSNSKLPQLVMGSELAHRLDANVSSTVRILSPLEKSGALGALPQSEIYQVSGLYTSGHLDFDEQYVFLELSDAQALLRKEKTITGWHLWTDSAEAGEKLQPKIASLIPAEWEAQSWSMFNAALFHSLRLEQYSMSTILSFAILIAVMNIVITLTMHANHKRKNIGILRALGASRSQVRRIFIWQGAFLGGIGLCIGGLLTLLIIVYLRYLSPFQLPAFYYDRSIPIEVRPFSMLVIYVVATLLIFLATLYPSHKAASLDPIEAIRE